MNNKSANPLILVADDEINTTLMVQHIFEREGFRVERVNNGIAALEGAKTLAPDLILLDILMPGMNGFDVLRHLREDEQTRFIPTILMTANARQPDNIALGLDLGADDYITKPFAHQELVARANSKIKAHKLQEALKHRTQELEALLHVSERFGEHLMTGELLALSVQLLHELLPCDVAAIYQLNDDNQIEHHRIHQNEAHIAAELPHNRLIELATHMKDRPASAIDADFIKDMNAGIIAPLRHANRTIGVVVVLSTSESYDDDQFRLFTGIASQAALALHNAQLYEFQLSYAQRLEEKVDERTRQLQSTQQMLIRSEKLASIGHMVASLAHEINTPLMPIKLVLEDFIAQLDDQHIEYDAESVKVIQDSIERIQRIIRRLLDFTRTSNGDAVLLDLAQILEGIIKLNQKFFEHAHIRIDSHIDTLPAIHGSKDQLEQVFMNLALNAQAAMPDGGTLSIGAHTDNEDVVIRFQDSGYGIRQDNLHKIFDPFFSTKPNGTGLGLFVSYGIIQAHHGSIDVNSTLGVGTEFVIRLPIHQPEAHL